jgi:DNA-binding response OmpR family regulator
MALVLVASDLPSLRASVRATLEGPDLDVIEASSGRDAIKLAVDHEVELAILDLQIGAMGGVAICSELRNLESYDARRCGAEGFCVKPLAPVRLRRAARAVLEGGTFEDDTWRPVTVGQPRAVSHG